MSAARFQAHSASTVLIAGVSQESDRPAGLQYALRLASCAPDSASVVTCCAAIR